MASAPARESTSKLLFRIRTLAKEPNNSATAVQTIMITLNGMLPSGNGIVTTHDSVTKEMTRGEEVPERGR